MIIILQKRRMKWDNRKDKLSPDRTRQDKTWQDKKEGKGEGKGQMTRTKRQKQNNSMGWDGGGYPTVHCGQGFRFSF